MKSRLFYGAALGLVTMVSPAVAQQVDDDEVVVTAQRRGENIRDVPFSVTAVGGEDLTESGIQNTQDLTLVVPGLTFARSTIAGAPTIRGIGTRSASTGNEGNVAMYLDGVYLPQPFASVFELADIERIEVLKGPQGTLYGRNATGGAINIITRRPSFESEGDLSVSVGSFGYYRGTGYVSGAIVPDVLAGSFSVVQSEDDGYIDNVYLNNTTGGRELTSFRGQLLFQATDRAQFRLNLLDAFSNTTDNNSPFWLEGNTTVRTSPNPGGIPLDILIPEGPFQTSTAQDPKQNFRAQMVDLFGDFEFDGVNLSTILSYHHNRGFSDRLTDASPLALTRVIIRPQSDTYIAEAVLSSSNDGPLQWVAGINYMDDDTQATPQFVNTAESHYGIATRAASAFGEVTYQFGERFFVTGGLRYSWEEKDAFNTQTGTGVTVRGNDSWNAVTPRVSLRYELTDTSNVYFTYSQGFKSGSFDASGAAGAQLSVDPELVDAYEIGYRGDLGDSLRLSLAAYAYNYTDLQAVVINAGPGFSFSQLQNAADSEIRGFEGTLDWFATDNLQFTAGVSLLDTEFTSFPNASITVPRPQVGGEYVGNVNTVADLSGYSLIRAPEWTLNLGGEYSTPLFDGEFTANANVFISDSYFFDINNRVEQPAYTVVNASATWRPNSAPGLRFTLNGYNLTDELYFAQVFSSGNGDAAVYQRPQWFALTVGYSY